MLPTFFDYLYFKTFEFFFFKSSSPCKNVSDFLVFRSNQLWLWTVPPCWPRSTMTGTCFICRMWFRLLQYLPRSNQLWVGTYNGTDMFYLQDVVLGTTILTQIQPALTMELRPAITLTCFICRMWYWVLQNLPRSNQLWVWILPNRDLQWQGQCSVLYSLSVRTDYHSSWSCQICWL